MAGACKAFLLLEFILSESFILSGSQIRFRNHLLFTEVKSQKQCLPWEEKKLIFLYSGVLWSHFKTDILKLILRKSELSFSYSFCLTFKLNCVAYKGVPGSSAGKESPCNAGDPGVIPGSGRSAGEGNSYPLQCSWASPCGLYVELLGSWGAVRTRGFPWTLIGCRWEPAWRRSRPAATRRERAGTSCRQEQPGLSGDSGAWGGWHTGPRCVPGNVLLGMCPCANHPLAAPVGPGRSFHHLTQLVPPSRKPLPYPSSYQFPRLGILPLLAASVYLGCSGTLFWNSCSSGCVPAGTVAAVWDAPGEAVSSQRRFPVGLSDESGLRPFSSPRALSCVLYPPLPGGCLSCRGALHTPRWDSAFPSEMV